ncbi:hypothetical protein G5V58_06205 [Nocardioides anomalus]|uniref:Uncharacterized protein n=1 Tax=Nocardioides anomalus TaxID=2712223 RepID=A0A6G6WB83_9ACTN|nr:hypothetical protein [Nocardioides anomalus]QIG42417.1 hypothetical protein G5V58_06205 [Nocardioides anomalus]
MPPLLVALLLTLPAPAAPEVRLDLHLDRGPAPAVAHVEGTTVVDGHRRIPVEASDVQLVGPSGTWYVVVADGTRVQRVASHGRVTDLGATDGDPVRLSVDGSQVAATVAGSGRTTLTLRSAVTGAEVGERSLRGAVTALDVDAGRVVASGPRRTLVWNAVSGHTRVVSRRPAYAASFGHDLVALEGRRLAEGSCTRLVRLSTGAEHWTSCTDSLLSFGPDASRWVTTAAYQDGPTSRVTLRDGTGRELARYRLAGGLQLDELRWEDVDTVLLRASGPQASVWFRCVGADCELAGPVSARLGASSAH